MTFIEEAKKEYDILIFDSTPVLSTADAAILGTKVDGVLLVYRIGSVSRGLLKRSSTQLQQVNCKIAGVILNGMKPDISPDFQDYKYFKYYSYYGEEEKETGSSNRIWPFQSCVRTILMKYYLQVHLCPQISGSEFLKSMTEKQVPS